MEPRLKVGMAICYWRQVYFLPALWFLFPQTWIILPWESKLKFKLNVAPENPRNGDRCSK